jgi:hypothetical protein
VDELCANLPAMMETNWMIQLAPVLVAFDRVDSYLQHVGELTESPWLRAGTAIASGDWERGAEIVDSTGAIADAAEIRLSAGETLIGGGRRAEGEAHLRRALEFYRSVGADGFVRQGEALLAATA